MLDNTYLTFDIGGTKIASGVVSLPPAAGAPPQVSDRCEIPTEAQSGGDEIRRRLVAFAEERLRACAAQHRHIDGIGIAAAGVVDAERGVIAAATDILPGWKGQRIAEAFAAVTDLPVAMVGDVGAHGLGEAIYGAGRGHKTVLSLGLGTGIGGAYIVDGRLVTGAHGVAGHAGHVVSGLGKGFLCSCGTTSGHIEPVASGSGLATLYNHERPADVEPAADGREVCERAALGEAYAGRVLERSARALGECVAGMANLLDPHAIVLSGSVVQAGPVWWRALRDGFMDGALELVRQTPLIEGELGGAAPLIGAAHAVRTARRGE
ncbi:ROK family protein [Bifidobacterium eulemuris]|uniref:ROK family protein n=1 Tax=Bifidobacterium eulemuris TaxID=1765219 RepID=A0A261G0N0_9BIFI|nr:ROK family protein [Bifidobacterium eulemuris]OZG64723.1 ROK family transcriptional regulator [Bifidobacterium eulemuris]QOL32471.1 ROK family protein [Bifidobacterium eulemuris]